MALGFTMLTGCGTTPLRGQTPAPTADENKIEVVDTPQTPVQDSLQHEREVRKILIEDAQKRFMELAPKARTGYSAQLDSLEVHMRHYLKNDTTRHNNIIVLDPTQADVAIALGMPVMVSVLAEVIKDTPQDQLKPDAPPVPFDEAFRASRNMAASYRSAAGIRSYTQNPSAYANHTEDAPRPCLIVPVSDHAIPFTIKGMSFDQKTEFGNTHEGWHCLDSKYSLNKAQMTALDSVDIRDFKAVLAMPDAIGAVSQIQSAEMLADVAGLGDMIRRGHGSDIIDATINWRTENTPFDFAHYSVPALKALKAHIEKTGLEAFRAQSFETARDLYIRLTDENRLTPTRLTTALQYLTGDDAQRTALDTAALTDGETKLALEYARHMKPDPLDDLIRGLGMNMPRVDTVLQQKLKDWDFVGTLENAAIKAGGAITPASLIEAYGTVQDSLRTDMVRGVNEVENREKMTLMKTFFTAYVTGVDYVAANAKHGIDIEVAAKDILAAGRAARQNQLPGHLPGNVIEFKPLPVQDVQKAPPAGQKLSNCGCGIARKPG